MAEDKELHTPPNNQKEETAETKDIDYVAEIGEEKVRQLLKDYAGYFSQDETKIADLLDTYITAKENPIDKKVFNFLFSLDNESHINDLANYEFLPLAIEQKKKTDFNRIFKGELKKWKEKIKQQEKENRELYFRQAKENHSYYGEKVSEQVIETILIENNVDVKLNLATHKVEINDMYGELLSEYSRENWLNTLPIVLFDICKENEVTGLSQGTKIITSYLNSIADKNRYNPILDMLKKYRNDNEENLQRLSDILNLKEELHKTFFKKWLIQTVALAHNTLQNPVQAEGVLVLQGSQAKGKTSFFRKLAGNRDWFTEGASIDVRNKDSIINATGSWICELGELDSTLKKEQAELKAFITQSVDNIRLPYATTATETPRTTSFCGTVNEERFLKDETGNRRYWVIPIDYIDKTELHKLTKEDIFSMWGYIEYLYQQDKNSFRLNDIELQTLNMKNESFRSELPFEQEVLSLLDFNKSVELWVYCSPSDISTHIRKGNLGNSTAKAIGKVLTKLQKSHKEIEKKRKQGGYIYLLPINISEVEQIYNFK